MKTEKKRKKKWPIVLAAVLVLGALAYFGGNKGTTSPQPGGVPGSPSDDVKKEDIQAAVESLVDEKYRGQGYSLDLLTTADGSGYIVSLQIDVDVVPPESAKIISDLESRVFALGYDQIAEVQILAVKDMQIIDGNIGGYSANSPTVKYGELLELNDNREEKDVVVVKAKISPSTTNKLTVEQNFHNVVDLVKNQGFDNCELQYWAVADMSNSSEDKVISFTVPQDVVEQVASGDVVATELQDLVVDLWILPSLKN